MNAFKNVSKGTAVREFCRIGRMFPSRRTRPIASHFRVRCSARFIPTDCSHFVLIIAILVVVIIVVVQVITVVYYCYYCCRSSDHGCFYTKQYSNRLLPGAWNTIFRRSRVYFYGLHNLWKGEYVFWRRYTRCYCSDWITCRWSLRLPEHFLRTREGSPRPWVVNILQY